MALRFLWIGSVNNFHAKDLKTLQLEHEQIQTYLPVLFLHERLMLVGKAF
jgi:hypothetical protein